MRKKGKLKRNTKDTGFTMLELLIVMAVLGIALGIGIGQFLQINQRQRALATVDQIRQLFWQGATAAASRGGITYELVRNNSTLTVRVSGGGSVLNTITLPTGVTTNLPNGTLLTFDPPGKLSFLAPFPNNRQFTVTANETTYTLTVTLLGEVRRQ